MFGTLLLLGTLSFQSLGLNVNANNFQTKPSTIVNAIRHKSEMLIANAEMEKAGIKASLSAEFPKKGGVVKGTINGDCTGKITGYYSGSKTRDIKGVAFAQCRIFFFKINGVARFDGKINDSNTSASVNYKAEVMGKTKTGTQDFSISQK